MNTEIENKIKELKEVVSMRTSLEKLYKNKDFIKVVSDGYFANEPTRLTMIRPMVKAEYQSNIDDAFKAVGLFSKYLEVVMSNGEQAQNEIDKLEAELNPTEE